LKILGSKLFREIGIESVAQGVVNVGIAIIQQFLTRTADGEGQRREAERQAIRDVRDHVWPIILRHREHFPKTYAALTTGTEASKDRVETLFFVDIRTRFFSKIGQSTQKDDKKEKEDEQFTFTKARSL